MDSLDDVARRLEGDSPGVVKLADFGRHWAASCCGGATTYVGGQAASPHVQRAGVRPGLETHLRRASERTPCGLGCDRSAELGAWTPARDVGVCLTLVSSGAVRAPRIGGSCTPAGNMLARDVPHGRERGLQRSHFDFRRRLDPFASAPCTSRAEMAVAFSAPEPEGGARACDVGAAALRDLADEVVAEGRAVQVEGVEGKKAEGAKPQPAEDAGVIARLPGGSAHFVPMPLKELAEGPLGDVAERVREVLCAAFGWESAEGVRVLFQERDLDREAMAAALLEALGAGQPCILRVLFRLLGGKGGFGALLRKQMGMGKKTTNFDAMRDLSGRRLRHSKAVDRIKEWMLEKKRQDELVNLLTGEGPELPKPTPETEALDPDYIACLQRSAANKPSLVKEGMRKLDTERQLGTSRTVGSEEPQVKRQRVSAAPSATSGGEWLSALQSLGTSSPEPDSGEEGGKEKDMPKAQAASASASSAGEVHACEPSDVRCKIGHQCARITENPKEPGYEEPACCDLCEAENLPGTRPFFFHCSLCEYDVCPTCAQNPPEDDEEPEEPEEEAAGGAGPRSPVAAPAVASSGSGDREAAQKPEVASASAASASAAATSASAASASAASASAASVVPAGASAAAAKPDDGRTLTAADVKEFSSVEQLVAEVPPEAIKRSLQKLGLKCGGRPEERASRLFLLKTTKLGAIPKAHFAAR